MKIAALTAFAIVFLLAGQAQAQTYKSIEQAEAQAAWQKSAMTVYDFLTVAKTLIGKSVSVRGAAECVSEMLCYLRDPNNPTLQVVIEPAALHRNDLQRLLGCHAHAAKCETTVTGRVGENGFGELRLAGKAK